MVVNPNSLHLIFYPDEVLRQATQEVDATDEHVQAVAARMIELMFESEGLGLAAPQVGLPWRLFVTRDPEDETKTADICYTSFIFPLINAVKELSQKNNDLEAKMRAV